MVIVMLVIVITLPSNDSGSGSHTNICSDSTSIWQ